MKDLFLLRGLPGSGKSTFASLICYTVLSADMYFEDSDGNYNFDGSKLKDAHRWCLSECEEDMMLETPAIAIANTFTQEWEMENYYKLAEQYGYRVHSLIVENRHGGVNQHGVPDDKLEQMKNRFEIKL
jgi:predicted kinase